MTTDETLAAQLRGTAMNHDADTYAELALELDRRFRPPVYAPFVFILAFLIPIVLKFGHRPYTGNYAPILGFSLLCIGLSCWLMFRYGRRVWNLKKQDLFREFLPDEDLEELLFRAKKAEVREALAALRRERDAKKIAVQKAEEKKRKDRKILLALTVCLVLFSLLSYSLLPS